jgi:acetyl esterase
MKIKLIIMAAGFLAFASALCAQSTSKPKAVNTNTVAYLANHGSFEPSREVVYKQIDRQALKLEIFDPKGFKTEDSRPCFLIIHGGGWVGGTAKSFYPFAGHFAKLGMVGISIDYRLIKKGSDVTPVDCVKDGRSAVRYVRSHAAELGIDPHKIIVSGGSAGGHVAACTAFCQGIDEAGEDNSISCVPNALVLYWPALDVSPEGLPVGHEKFDEHWKELSPLQLVRPGMPPTLVFHGSADRLVPLKGSQEFQDAMIKAGNHSELVVEPGAGHGYMVWNLKLFYEGMQRTDEFLASLGYLKK